MGFRSKLHFLFQFLISRNPTIVTTMWLFVFAFLKRVEWVTHQECNSSWDYLWIYSLKSRSDKWLADIFVHCNQIDIKCINGAFVWKCLFCKLLKCLTSMGIANIGIGWCKICVQNLSVIISNASMILIFKMKIKAWPCSTICKIFTNNINSKMHEIPINLYSLFLNSCVCKHDIGEGYYVTLNEYVRIFMAWFNLVYRTSS